MRAHLQSTPAPAWPGIAVIGIIAMTIVIAHGFLHGNLHEEGRWLLDHAWGRVTLVGLYVGFALFGFWVFQRKQSKLTASISLMLLGHLAAAVYVIRALIQSRCNVERFWIGNHP